MGLSYPHTPVRAHTANTIFKDDRQTIPHSAGAIDRCDDVGGQHDRWEREGRRRAALGEAERLELGDREAARGLARAARAAEPRARPARRPAQRSSRDAGGYANWLDPYTAGAPILLTLARQFCQTPTFPPPEVSRLPHSNADRMISCRLHQLEVNRELLHEFKTEIIHAATRYSGPKRREELRSQAIRLLAFLFFLSARLNIISRI